jgi:hypothetical protein
MRSDLATWPLLAVVAGCASTGPRMAAERDLQAQLDEAQSCDAGAPDLQALAPRQVERVEPVYFNIQRGRYNRDTELRATNLYVRAERGLTKEWLERTLACHRARRILKRAEPELTSDPFVLPDAWVHTRVESGGADFVVTLSGDEPMENQRILERARAFASSAK